MMPIHPARALRRAGAERFTIEADGRARLLVKTPFGGQERLVTQFAGRQDQRIWQRHEAVGAVAVPTPERGTFGRFRYVPRWNAFVVATKITDNVFLYKLTAEPGESVPCLR